MYKVQLVLPDEVMDDLQKQPESNWIPYLVQFFETGVLRPYEESLGRRHKGSFIGKPLMRYERTLYTDLLLDMAVHQLRERLEAKRSMDSAANIP
jgi:hypothetical protein